MKNITKYGAIILAGGRSSRMGQPKPWLLDQNGLTFLESLVNSYELAACHPIVVVLNDDFSKGVWAKRIEEISKKAVVVKNNQVDKGRFFSIMLALEHLAATDYVFLQNVDNPYAGHKLLQRLKEHKLKNGYTVPSYKDKGGHPILLSAELLHHISEIKDQSPNFRDVLRSFKREDVTVPWNEVLANVNTQESYQNYLKTEQK